MRVLQERLGPRHPLRPADPSLHALPETDELGRDVSANLIVALAAALGPGRAVDLLARCPIRSLDALQVPPVPPLGLELGARALHLVLDPASLGEARRASVVRQVTLPAQRLAQFRERPLLHRSRPGPSRHTFDATPLPRLHDGASAKRLRVANLRPQRDDLLPGLAPVLASDVAHQLAALPSALRWRHHHRRSLHPRRGMLEARGRAPRRPPHSAGSPRSSGGPRAALARPPGASGPGRRARTAPLGRACARGPWPLQASSDACSEARCPPRRVRARSRA